MSLGHVLIFGGTGMLQGASGWIAKNAKHTIAFGRNKQKLFHLQREYGVNGLEARMLDYTDNESLKQEINHSFIKHGPINMVVAWIHGTAPNAVPTIMKQVSALQENQWTFVIIKSSGNLVRIITPVKSTEQNCNIKEVQLGFIYNENNSRWLTHEEISEGTIEAIKGNKNKTIVGTLEPWEQRP
ncbi:MAG TPA: hypothetical protein VK085_00315 [Pseudogracilibacillus sp.]|nr:hypothetical protein [Pseudogracilibacillus sp.]